MASLRRRGDTYYAQYCVGGKVRRVSLNTTSIQIAKEKVRQIESAMLRQDDIPIPTRTRLPELLEEYVAFMKQHKTHNSLKSDLHYLREVFGPVCEALQAPRAKVVPKPNRVEAAWLEDVTTAELSRFIAHQVQTRGLGPKSANRYREVLHTLFTWAIDQRGVKMPGDRNPVKKVARYRERAPRISYLSLEQIDLQLRALAENPLLQIMVAVYIYAGSNPWSLVDPFGLEAGGNLNENDPDSGVMAWLSEYAQGNLDWAKGTFDSAVSFWLSQMNPMRRSDSALSMAGAVWDAASNPVSTAADIQTSTTDYVADFGPRDLGRLTPEIGMFFVGGGAANTGGKASPRLGALGGRVTRSGGIGSKLGSWWTDVAGEWQGWRKGFADTGRYAWNGRNKMKAKYHARPGVQPHDSIHHRNLSQGGTRNGAGKMTFGGFGENQYGRYVPNFIKNSGWNMRNSGQPICRGGSGRHELMHGNHPDLQWNTFPENLVRDK